VKPAKLLQSAGWLSLLLMLALASPGVRFVEAPEASPLDPAASRP
jgi:hypothetical protein